MKKQTTVAIDKALAQQIDEILAQVPGYLNRSEFAREAIRREVQRIKQKLNQEAEERPKGRGKT